MEPRDWVKLIAQITGINLVVLAFFIIKHDFPLSFLAAAFSLLIGLALLSAE